MELFILIIGGVLLWACSKYYWPGTIAVGFLMAIWGGLVIVAPIFLALRSFSNASVFVGLLQIGMGGFLGIFWMIVAKPLYRKFRRRIDSGEFWKAWNEEW